MSSLSEKLWDRVAERNPKTIRVPLQELQSAFDDVFPHLKGSVRARSELHQLLAELERAGRVTLPKGRAGFDGTQQPVLPKWIQLPRAPKSPGASERAAKIAWHPDLAFVTKLARLSDAELEALLRVQKFLSLPADGELLTMRERSLQIFGDDKRLERMLDSQLFGEGKLTPELLHCRQVFAPCVIRRHHARGEWLIVETKDTFHSVNEALAELGERSRIGTVVFGAGAGILAAAGSLRDQPDAPEQWFYFGDVDADGLRIAVDLSRSLKVLADEGLYAALVGRCEGLALQLKGKQVAEPEASRLTEWLGGTARESARRVITDGRRWPQEALTARDYRTLLCSAGSR